MTPEPFDRVIERQEVTPDGLGVDGTGTHRLAVARRQSSPIRSLDLRGLRHVVAGSRQGSVEPGARNRQGLSSVRLGDADLRRLDDDPLAVQVLSAERKAIRGER
jgi:hypothetical protein